MSKTFDRGMIGIALLMLMGCSEAQEATGGDGSTPQNVAGWSLSPKTHTTASSLESILGPLRPADGKTFVVVTTSFEYRSSYAPALPPESASFGLVSGVRMYNANAELPPEAIVLRDISLTAAGDAASSFVGFIVGTGTGGRVFHVKNIDEVALIPPGPKLDLVLYFSFPTAAAMQPMTIRYGAFAAPL